MYPVLETCLTECKCLPLLDTRDVAHLLVMLIRAMGVSSKLTATKT